MSNYTLCNLTLNSNLLSGFKQYSGRILMGGNCDSARASATTSRSSSGGTVIHSLPSDPTISRSSSGGTHSLPSAPTEPPTISHSSSDPHTPSSGTLNSIRWTDGSHRSIRLQKTDGTTLDLNIEVKDSEGNITQNADCFIIKSTSDKINKIIQVQEYTEFDPVELKFSYKVWNESGWDEDEPWFIPSPIINNIVKVACPIDPGLINAARSINTADIISLEALTAYQELEDAIRGNISAPNVEKAQRVFDELHVKRYLAYAISEAATVTDPADASAALEALTAAIEYTGLKDGDIYNNAITQQTRLQELIPADPPSEPPSIPNTILQDQINISKRIIDPITDMDTAIETATTFHLTILMQTIMGATQPFVDGAKIEFERIKNLINSTDSTDSTAAIRKCILPSTLTQESALNTLSDMGSDIPKVVLKSTPIDNLKILSTALTIGINRLNTIVSEDAINRATETRYSISAALAAQPYNDILVDTIKSVPDDLNDLATLEKAINDLQTAINENTGASDEMKEVAKKMLADLKDMVPPPTLVPPPPPTLLPPPTVPVAASSSVNRTSTIERLMRGTAPHISEASKKRRAKKGTGPARPPSPEIHHISSNSSNGSWGTSSNNRRRRNITRRRHSK